jgi:hypothetical protein
MAEARLAFDLEHVNVIAADLSSVVRSISTMPPLQNRRGFSRRPDRSLGWAAMEAKQASALARGLSVGAGDGTISRPLELLPFPPLPRRRVSAVDVLKRILVGILALQLCYLLTTAILISVYRYVDPPATVLIAYRKWFFHWKVQAPRPISLKKVPRYIRSMLISVEDGKFYEHHGIDFEAFQRAREINKRLGKRLYGGSTLTMQVARTLFLVPDKSYIRKYLEVLTALELEALLPNRGCRAQMVRPERIGSVARRGCAPCRPPLVARQVRASHAAAEWHSAGALPISGRAIRAIAAVRGGRDAVHATDGASHGTSSGRDAARRGSGSPRDGQTAAALAGAGSGGRGRIRCGSPGLELMMFAKLSKPL